MFRFVLLVSSIFLVSGSQLSCSDRDRDGECKAIKDCVTNEWTYGTLNEPLCDVVGSDYKDMSTKVCCFPVV